MKIVIEIFKRLLSIVIVWYLPRVMENLKSIRTVISLLERALNKRTLEKVITIIIIIVIIITMRIICNNYYDDIINKNKK